MAHNVESPSPHGLKFHDGIVIQHGPQGHPTSTADDPSLPAIRVSPAVTNVDGKHKAIHYSLETTRWERTASP